MYQIMCQQKKNYKLKATYREIMLWLKQNDTSEDA
jgi:hypothetical protein